MGHEDDDCHAIEPAPHNISIFQNLANLNGGNALDVVVLRYFHQSASRSLMQANRRSAVVGWRWNKKGYRDSVPPRSVH